MTIISQTGGSPEAPDDGGKGHLKLLLCPPEDPQHCLDAIALNVAAEDWPAADASEIDLVYRLERNEFRGQSSLQLMVEHIIASR